MQQSSVKMKLVALICFLSIWHVGAFNDSTSNQEKNDKSKTKLDGGNSRSPVILVPGLAGSRLEALIESYTERTSPKELEQSRLMIPSPQMVQQASTRAKSPFPHCKSQLYYGSWFTVFANYQLLDEPKCWNSLIELQLNSTGNGTDNAPGVRIRPYQFGSSEGVEYRDAEHQSSGVYFKTLADTLVERLGYRRQVDLFAATYDFRRYPDELEQSLFGNLSDLVEHAAERNNNQRVTLICHSMGCPITLLWLNKQTEQWRSRYVRRLVSMSGAFLGALVPVTGTLFADVPSILLMGNMSKPLRTFGSFAFLYPNWQDQSSQNLVVTADGSYGPQNFQQMLQKANLTDFERLYQLTRSAAQRARDLAPQVDTWCLYSNGLPTLEQVLAPNTKTADLAQYEQKRFKYETINGDGDGMVNSVSLQWCRKWTDRQSAPVQFEIFPGVGHAEILSDSKALDFLVTRVLSQKSQ